MASKRPAALSLVVFALLAICSMEGAEPYFSS